VGTPFSFSAGKLRRLFQANAFTEALEWSSRNLTIQIQDVRVRILIGVVIIDETDLSKEELSAGRRQAAASAKMSAH
jgi:hypothetical protein